MREAIDLSEVYKRTYKKRGNGEYFKGFKSFAAYEVMFEKAFQIKQERNKNSVGFFSRDDLPDFVASVEYSDDNEEDRITRVTIAIPQQLIGMEKILDVSKRIIDYLDEKVLENKLETRT